MLEKPQQRGPKFFLALALALPILAAGVLSACGGDDSTDQSAEAEESTSQEPLSTKVLLSYPEGPAWIGLPTAREVGFLEEENLEVETEAADGSDFVMQQVIADNVPYGFAATTSVLIGAEQDPSLRSVFCNTVRNIFGISVPGGSEISDLAAFEGAVLGISEQGGGETPMVEAALLDAGLTPGEDVELLPIGGSGPASQRAIEKGDVDGYASSYTDIIALQAGGVDLVDITPEKYRNIPGDCLVVKEESLNDTAVRDEIVRLARAWSKGSLYATSNPERALEISCESFPEDCTDEAFAEGYMNTRLELLTPAGASIGQTETPYGQPPVEGWQIAMELLVDSDQLSGPIDVEGIMATPEVEEVLAEWSDYDREEIKEQAE